MNPSSPDSTRSTLSRRDFIASTALAGTALVGAPALVLAQEPSPTHKRYALVGVGSRSRMYRDAILKTYADHCTLVGFCDVNEGRLELARRKARESTGADVPIYKAEAFDQMIRDTKPHTVIVTSKDATHSRYIIRAMELGCDVMTEKPMTTDETQCRAILDAQRKSGRHCRVTFNYRYSPHRTQVKDLLMSGAIGDVLSVDFHWLLDTNHGADYFRRWHSQKASSGGLMVHKATHHFDLVNWWLSAVPVSVVATGKREFYTPQTARRLGLSGPHERCHTCPEKDKCTFFFDLAADRSLKELYLDQEKHDGYFRDQCVWRPEIDIEDTMNVLVHYNTGATMSYSLNAFNGWEGYIIAFNGTQGRLELKEEERVYAAKNNSDPRFVKPEGTYIRIYPMRAPAYQVETWKGTGSHGGGDRVMLDDLFLAEKPADKYLRASDQRGGAWSILTGIAANHSFRAGKSIAIADLVPDLALPDYPPMPSREIPVRIPRKA